MLSHIQYLVPSNIKLSQIFLDPNNPRFVEEQSEITPYENYTNTEVQSNTIRILERKFGLRNLQESIISNGYLPIDRIVIKEIDHKKDEKIYLVLEGNRRVAAAKVVLEKILNTTIKVEKYIQDSLYNIPVLIYTGSDENAAWTFQGLRHISGIKSWSAIQKAKLLVSKMEENNLSYTDAGKIFGISNYSAGQWARAYYAYLDALEVPDFKEDIDYRCFPYLQELFGRSDVALREWLDWNDDEKRFLNEENFAEYLNWLYPKYDDNNEYDPETPGEWDKRRIPTAQDQRLISQTINTKGDLFNGFRQGDSITIIRLKLAEEEQEKIQTVDYYINYFGEVEKELKDIPVLKLKEEQRDIEIQKKIDRIAKTLNGLKTLFDKK